MGAVHCLSGVQKVSCYHQRQVCVPHTPTSRKVQKVIRLKSRLVYFHTFTVILSDLCYLVCERTKLNFLKYLIVDRTIAYKLFVG